MSGITSVVGANNKFAVDLFHQLGDGNQLVSPYSLSSALTMLLAGARNATAVEIGDVLRFPASTRNKGSRTPWNTKAMLAAGWKLSRDLIPRDDEATRELRKEVASLRKSLQSSESELKKMVTQGRRGDDQYFKLRSKVHKIVNDLNERLPRLDQFELRISNALWCQRGWPFEEPFVQLMEDHCDPGGIFAADFARNPNRERKRINKWVAGQTRDRIPELIPPGHLDRLTRLVITNAIYFLGKWDAPFKNSRTKRRKFTLANRDTIQTPTMSNPLTYLGYAGFKKQGKPFDTPKMIDLNNESPPCYPDDDGFLMTELPYQGERLSMVVVVPRDPAKLPALEQELSAPAIKRWMKRLEERDVELQLPKFRLNHSYQMADTLSELGMPRAFLDPSQNKNGANLRGISDIKDPERQLFVSQVIHKTFLDVNEKGTEAAAATAILPRAAKKAFRKPKWVPFIPQFHADRPFLVWIRDRQTNLLLFMGRMMDPREGERDSSRVGL